MTMILTCLTNDYIVQVSDRRLSTVVGKKVQMVEDRSNKALIYSNHFVFAYTGLAKLPYQSAIDWAAQQLSEKANLRDAVLHLGSRASELMNSNLIRTHYARFPAYVKRLAFVGAGSAHIVFADGTIVRRPLRLVISNFFSIEDGGTWLPQPSKEFSVASHWFPEGRDCELFVSGQQLPEDRQTQFARFLTRCVQHKVRPETIGVHLTREILAVAATNDSVGKNIMITFVPRAFGDKRGLHTGGIQLETPVFSTEPQQLQPARNVPLEERIVILPPFDSPRYMYIPDDNETLTYHSPIYVGPGGVMGPLIMSDMSTTIPGFVPAPTQEPDTSL